MVRVTKIANLVDIASLAKAEPWLARGGPAERQQMLAPMGPPSPVASRYRWSANGSRAPERSLPTRARGPRVHPGQGVVSVFACNLRVVKEGSLGRVSQLLELATDDHVPGESGRSPGLRPLPDPGSGHRPRTSRGGVQTGVGVRLKRNGTRWSPAGAESTLSLRTVWLNGQWDAFWTQWPLTHAA
jgi:hypothetical protein